MAARKASHAGSWYTESSKFDPLFREVTLAYFCFILMWHPKWSMALIMSSDLLNLSIYAFQHKNGICFGVDVESPVFVLKSNHTSHH